MGYECLCLCQQRPLVALATSTKANVPGWQPMGQIEARVQRSSPKFNLVASQVQDSSKVSTNSADENTKIEKFFNN
jgi:hypothetical protein